MKRKLSPPLLLAVELVLTLCVGAFLVAANLIIVRNEAEQYTSEIESDYMSLENRYVSVFKAMTIPIREEIESDPSFSEMNAWLQAREELFRDAVGENIYDGFAMTYKGGYAHSWNYGDYSDYDPGTRIWYQEAQKAAGAVTVVAPYVTYLGPQYPNSDQYIEMTIAQKYSGEISFDLDLKIHEVNSLLSGRGAAYAGTSALLFDRGGYILSTTDNTLYCHNINNPDDVLSEDASRQFLFLQDNPGKLRLMRIDGSLRAVYALQDVSGNTYCVMFPFATLFVKNFLSIGLAVLLLIFLEAAVYVKNKHTVEGMSERDRRITEITRAAFQEQLFVDLTTMKCSGDGFLPGFSHESDYRTVYRFWRDSAADGASLAEVEAFLAPEVLAGLENSGLSSRKIAFGTPEKDGSKSNRILEISRYVSALSGKKAAVLLGNDVTDRERGQRRIIQSIAHYYSSALIGSAECGTADVIKLDPYYASVYSPGIGTEELHRRYAEKYLQPEYVSDYLSAVSPENIAQRLARSEGYRITFRLRDGHWFAVRVIRCEGYEENRQFVFFSESADEQMHRQAQLEDALDRANRAAKAKSDFLSCMSHDIRTPMNGIIGMTHIAAEQQNPPETQKCLGKIETSSKFLLGLVNDILDMAKVESGKVELHPEPYRFSDFGKYLDAVIRPLCGAKHLEFVVDAVPVGGIVPLFDPMRINQILFNLLSNAVKYTPEGGTVFFRLREKLAGNGRLAVSFEISDNGVGISDDFQKVLFEPFTQERRNDVSPCRGTGLGLAITKRTLDLMGGTISVRSKVGEGTAFFVQLETDWISENSPAAAPAAEQAEDFSQLAGIRVLLCEDHPLNQEIAKALLEEKRILVDLAENGRRGVEMFCSSPEGCYGAVLMDIRMPVLDGYGAAGEIRALPRSDAKTVPIIAMTADAFADDVQKCLDCGMNAHIAKPIDPVQLYRALSAASAQNRSRGKTGADG